MPCLAHKRNFRRWSCFQAKGEKQNLAELGAILAARAEDKRIVLADIEKYKQQKLVISAKAGQLEQQVEASNQQSEQQLHRHHRWAQATMLTQIAIALFAITLLTRRRWLQSVTLMVGIAGLCLALLAGFGI